jgi:hypothetical protein
MPSRHRALRFGTLQVAVLAVGAVWTAVVWMPWRESRGMISREEAALTHLRRLAEAESTFRTQRRLDADHDGTPEYGSLEELAGAGLLPSPLVRPAPGSTDLPHLETDGYRYEVLLPSAAESSLPMALARAGQPRPPGLAHRYFAVVAIPDPSPSAPRRAFYLDSAGRLYVGEGVTDADRDPVVPVPTHAFDRDATDPRAPGPIWRIVK